MTVGLHTKTVRVNGHDSRVWRKGAGAVLGFLPGVGGLPRWTPFLDRLAQHRTVIAPSLPGLPGATGHDELDTIFDWLRAPRALLLAAGLEGADLMAVSVSGALAADAAGVWPGLVRRLVLVSPFGLFDAADPGGDIWAQRPGHLGDMLCAERETYKAFIEQPDDVDPIEWKVEQMRALDAHARYLFPNGSTGLARRLGRIRCPVLLLRGSEDRVIPAPYLDRFAAGVAGPCRIEAIAGAGHLAELDQPDAVAGCVLDWLT